MNNQLSHLPDDIVPIWFTPGAEERSLRIQRLFSPIAVQLKKLLGRSDPFPISVLSEEDWGPLSDGVPFMLPAYDPNLASTGMVLIPAIPVKAGMDLLEPNNGWTATLAAESLYDIYCLAGMSCLGNVQSGTTYPTLWLRNIMNFYVMAYATRLADPSSYAVLVAWRRQWTDPINAEGLGMLELESFDFLADTMDISQFYQYQTAFLRRAIDICEQDLGNFYAQYIQAMATESHDWTEREALRKISRVLEAIIPGWVYWTETFSTVHT